MNVLFLMVDEMAWWALERRYIHTPNLDRLAAQGRVFEQAYTPAPICVPARAAIATGRYQHEIGYWDSTMGYDGRVPSWGHALQAAGIETRSFGKLHYRDGAAPTGFDHQALPVHVPGEGWPLGPLRQPLADYTATAGMAEDVGIGWTDYTRQDAAVTQAACDWLASPDRAARPWGAFVSWLSPHYPLIAPEEDMAAYPPTPYGADALPEHPVLQQIGAFFDHDRFFTDQGRGQARAAYYGLCSFVDRQIGAVLARVDLSETLVVMTSDHGEMLGEKGIWGKSVMYDSSTRVPLILAGPGVTPDRWTAPVSLIDIAPTLCAAAGTPLGHGRDLRQPDPERMVLSEYHDGGCPVGVTMLRWDRWKYVHYAQSHPPQLFDLAADPQELVDLAMRQPDSVAEARNRLFSMMDPEATDRQAFADQAVRIAELGGRAALETAPQWHFTPVPS